VALLRTLIHTNNLTQHILVLQEVRVSTNTLRKMFGRNSYSYIHPTAKAAGVAVICMRNDITLEHRAIGNDFRAMLTIARASFRPEPFHILNIYAPVEEQHITQPPFWGRLFDAIDDIPALDVILGDFNVAMYEGDRITTAPNGATDRCAAYVRQNLAERGFTDLGSHLSDRPDHTFLTFGRGGSLSSSRLDYIFVKQDDRSHYVNLKVAALPNCISDHSMVSCEWKISTPHRLPAGRAKRVKPALFATLPKRELQEELLLVENTHIDHVLTAWEQFKKNIITKCSKSTLHRYHHLREDFKFLCKKLTKVEKRISSTTSERYRRHIIKASQGLRNRLDQLIHPMSDSDKRKAFATWCKEGQRPTKFFYTKMRAYTPPTHITSLRHEASQEALESVHGMSDVLHTFYSKQFTPEQLDVDVQEDILHQIPDLLGDATSSLEESITVDEVHYAIQKAKNGKTPGKDGIPAEFYKLHKDTVAQALCRLFNAILRNNIPTQGFSDGLITLLYKKGDPTLLKNYRPITLLNVDYKLYTSILVNRLQQPLTKVLSQDQHAFLKSRLITDNILEVKLNLILAEQTKQTGFAVFLDQEKAYDRVDHEFLFKVLRKYGISATIIETIRNLYTGSRSTVLLNGGAAATVDIRRGVKQGDGLSCLLFVFIMDAFHKYMDARGAITPLRLIENSDYATVAKMYADDTVGIVSSEEDVLKFIQITEQYGTGSGIKINVDKTEILLLGPKEARTLEKVRPILRTRFGANIRTDGVLVRHLGIWVGYNADITTRFGPMLEKLDVSTSRLSRKDLQLKGRTLLAWSMLHSVIMYQAMHADIPAPLLASLQRRINTFICKGKIHVPQNLLYGAREKGGLGAPNLALSISAARIMIARRAILNPSLGWVKLFDEHFRRCHVSHIPTVSQVLLQTALPAKSFNNVDPLCRSIWSSWREHTKIHPASTGPLRPDDRKLIPIWGSFWLGPLGCSRGNQHTATLRKAGIRTVWDLTHHRNMQNILPPGVQTTLTETYDKLPLSWTVEHTAPSQLVGLGKALQIHIANRAFSFESLTTRGICRALRDTAFPPPPPTAASLLQSVLSNPACPRVQQHMWRLLHNILPTRDRLGFVEDKRCPLCMVDLETNKHVLRECAETEAVIRQLQPHELVVAGDTSASVLLDETFLPPSPLKPGITIPMWNTVICTGLHEAWLRRCAAVFGPPRPLTASIERTKWRLRANLYLFNQPGQPVPTAWKTYLVNVCGLEAVPAHKTYPSSVQRYSQSGLARVTTQKTYPARLRANAPADHPSNRHPYCHTYGFTG
jgi:exonuclease III